MVFYILTILGVSLAVALLVLEYQEQKKEECLRLLSWKLGLAILAVIATSLLAVNENHNSSMQDEAFSASLLSAEQQRDGFKDDLLKAEQQRDGFKDDLSKAEQQRDESRGELCAVKGQLQESQKREIEIKKMLTVLNGQLLESQLNGKETHKRLNLNAKDLSAANKRIAELVRSQERKKKLQDQEFKKWAAGKVDLGNRKLGGASGRRIGAWYTISRSRQKDGGTGVTISFQGRCSSNNDLFGSQGTFRLEIGGQKVSQVSTSCSRKASKKSKVEKYTLTDEQVENFDPTKVVLTRDYS